MNDPAQKDCFSCPKKRICKDVSVKNRPKLSRRNFLKLCVGTGIVAAAPFLILNKLSATPQTQKWDWQGRAMGTNISLQICHESQQKAQAITRLCVDEISRLEALFTLYSKDSELVLLNKTGSLHYPSPEMVELMSIAQRYGQLTNGNFDMTLQPVWSVVKEEGIDSSNIKAALDLVDYRQVKISPQEISFAKEGMAVSLNGIAQGYITDKINALLLSNGIKNALVNLGEIRALGHNEKNKPWSVGLRDPRQDNIHAYFKKISLHNKAISTTGGYGTPLSKDGKTHHIFNPQSGKSENHYLSLSVIANSATKADALSTALYVMKPEHIQETLDKLSDVSIVILHNNGSIETLNA